MTNNNQSSFVAGYSIVDENKKQIEWALTEKRAKDIIRRAFNLGINLEIVKND